MLRSKYLEGDSTLLCKKHPKHRQSPGVCSLCLTEKLVKLPFTGSRIIGNIKAAAGVSSSSSSSSLYSDISSLASPHKMLLSSSSFDHHRGYPQRFASDLRRSSALSKSRSLAFVGGNGGRRGAGGGGSERDVIREPRKKKKRMFSLWFLEPRRKRDEHPVLSTYT
ncbi:hypothetical protein Dimus_006177 [Dionaea muscipula]